MRVCLVPRLLIASGLMCCNMDLYDWLNNFCNFIWLLWLVLLVGVILHLKHVIETNLIKLS